MVPFYLPDVSTPQSMREAPDCSRLRATGPSGGSSWSCPWWSRARARRAICSPPAGAPGVPLQTMVTESESTPWLTGSWTGLQPGHDSHIKSLALKGSSYLWAELIAWSKSETLDLVRVECPSLGQHGCNALLVQSTCILSGPLRNITGPCSHSGELESCARLRLVPC